MKSKELIPFDEVLLLQKFNDILGSFETHKNQPLTSEKN